MKTKITSFKTLKESDLNRHSLLAKNTSPLDFDPKMFENISSQRITTDPNLEMSCYLKDKINVLEKENGLLKNELGLKMNEKDKFEYFLRMRKELLEEVQSLKSEINSKEIHYKIQLDKLEDEIDVLKKKEKDFKDHILQLERTQKSTIDLRKGTSSVTNPSPKVRMKDVPSGTPRESLLKHEKSKNKSKFNLGSLNEEKKNNEQEINQVEFEPRDEDLNLELNNAEDREMLDKSESSNFIDTMSRQASGLDNPYTTLIAELKNQIKYLETNSQEKDERFNALSQEYEKMCYENETTIEELKRSVEKWQGEYHQQLVRNKTLYDEYLEMVSKREKAMKDQYINFNFDLEKKVLHLEKVNSNLTSEMDKINEMNTSYTKESEAKIKRISDQNTKLLFKYEELWKQYEEDLNALTDLINKIKQKFIDREIEVLDLKIYYNNAVNEYSKPITELKNNKFTKIEETYVKQIKEVEEIKDNLTNYVNDNAKLQTDLLEARPKFRQKIVETSVKFEKALKDITGKHLDLDSKLSIIQAFMKNFQEKFTFFQSLIEDKKNLEEKCQALEVKVNSQGHSVYNEKEIVILKEQLLKCQTELELKSTQLKNIEEFQSKKTGKNQKKSETTTEDSVTRFQNEIALLNTKVSNLQQVKDTVENFYQQELKVCLQKLEEKTEKIDELMIINKKMHNDYFGKKESIFNLWMLEFEEFRDKLLSINELKNVINKFDAKSDDLKVLQHNVFEEELMYLRQEVNKRENDEDKFKKVYLDQIAALKKINENFKESLNEKMKNLDIISRQRQMEIEALLNEKQKIMENEKKKVNNLRKAEKLDTDEKVLFTTISAKQFKAKEEEVSELKIELEKVGSEVEFHKERFKTSFEEVRASVQQQIALIKERESFTNKQFNDLEEKFNNMTCEKDRVILLQKEELDNLNKNNKILAKLKLEKFN